MYRITISPGLPVRTDLVDETNRKAADETQHGDAESRAVTFLRTSQGELAIKLDLRALKV